MPTPNALFSAQFVFISPWKIGFLLGNYFLIGKLFSYWEIISEGTFFRFIFLEMGQVGFKSGKCVLHIREHWWK